MGSDEVQLLHCNNSLLSSATLSETCTAISNTNVGFIRGANNGYVPHHKQSETVGSLTLLTYQANCLFGSWKLSYPCESSSNEIVEHGSVWPIFQGPVWRQTKLRKPSVDRRAEQRKCETYTSSPRGNPTATLPHRRV